MKVSEPMNKHVRLFRPYQPGGWETGSMQSAIIWSPTEYFDLTPKIFGPAWGRSNKKIFW